jgi:glutamyl-Q tRNA(Asp) synthetase
MEDLDAARVIPGSAAQILQALEHFGLTWDGPVLYQSSRRDAYEDALLALQRAQLTFACSCSRRELPPLEESGYPGTCRQGTTRPGPHAIRLRIDERLLVLFDDRIQGLCRCDLGVLGDFVIRRKDGIPSYQLAVVTDDAAQGVTDVVRGADLQSSTAWQIALHAAFGLLPPRYAHLPLVVARDGEKLSKSRQSIAVSGAPAGRVLESVLPLLDLQPPPDLRGAGPPQLLAWACANWSPQRLHGRTSVLAPAAAT